MAGVVLLKIPRRNRHYTGALIVTTMNSQQVGKEGYLRGVVLGARQAFG